MKKVFTMACRMVVMAMALLTLSTANVMASTQDDNELEEILREVVAEINSECPADLGDGVVLNKLILNSKNMVMDFRMDYETALALVEMNNIAPEETEALFMQLMFSSGEEMIALIVVCAGSERGLEFRISDYNGSISTSIMLTVYDLASYFDGVDVETLLMAMLMGY